MRQDTRGIWSPRAKGKKEKVFQGEEDDGLTGSGNEDGNCWVAVSRQRPLVAWLRAARSVGWGKSLLGWV